MNNHLVKMVDSIHARFPLAPQVKDAMLRVPRECFVQQSMIRIAYELDALPLGAEQFISSPLTVAKMTQYLELDNHSKVLEVGLGSGYQAAVISRIVRGVFSVERISRLKDDACERFRALKIYNVITKVGDGCDGWESHAPFDRVLFSAGVREIPPKIIKQLSDGGIVVAPIIQRDDTQIITRFAKRSGGLEVIDSRESCRFVLVKNGVEW